MIVSLPSLIIGLGLLTIVFIAGAFLGGLNAVLKEKKRVRTLDISVERPRCPQCDYVAIGWSQPICPECGNDVSDLGVQVGPRYASAWAFGIVDAAVLCYGFPALLFAASFLLPSSLSSIASIIVVVALIAATGIAARFLGACAATIPSQGYAQPVIRDVPDMDHTATAS